MKATYGIHLHRTDGEHSRQAKLDWRIVRHLRASFSRKPASMGIDEFCSDWAAMFGVSVATVKRVIRWKNWRA